MEKIDKKTLALLREKALLLLRRERELLTMKQAKSRAMAWLNAVYKLSREADPFSDIQQICSTWASILMRDLGFQIAGCFALQPKSQIISPILWQTPSGKKIESQSLDPNMTKFLKEGEAGFTTYIKEGIASSLHRLTGLEKIYWYMACPGHGDDILLLSGFKLISGSIRYLEEEDAGYFRMMGQHLTEIIKNSRLVSELSEEKHKLVDLNRNLENLVKERTQELAQTNQELTESLDSLRQAEQQLHQAVKLAAIGELSAGVAHELNQPITSIRGFLQLLQSDADWVQIRQVDGVIQ